MTSFVLSVDELRAAARLAGVPVPPLAADADPDDPRVDLAALRSLAARGLVEGLAEADPEPAGALAATTAALDGPAWLLDVEIDAGDHPRWNGIGVPGGSASLAALPGGLVEVDLGADPLDAEDLADRCGLPNSGVAIDRDGIDDSADGFEVVADLHTEADALVLAGDPDAATAALVDGGVPTSVARQWVDAVVGRRSAVAVRIARRRSDGEGAEVRELRWLVGGDGRVWWIDGGSAADADDIDDDADDAADRSRVRLVDARQVRAAVADLLPGRLAAGSWPDGAGAHGEHQ